MIQLNASPLHSFSHKYIILYPSLSPTAPSAILLHSPTPNPTLTSVLPLPQSLSQSYPYFSPTPSPTTNPTLTSVLHFPQSYPYLSPYFSPTPTLALPLLPVPHLPPSLAD